VDGQLLWANVRKRPIADIDEAAMRVAIAPEV
jgi:hypothetical protein